MWSFMYFIKHLFKVLVVLLSLVLVSCSVKPPEEKEIKKGKNKIEIVFEGVIYPSRSFKIVSPISARIERVYKHNGDRVKKGDKIIKFDMKSLEIEYKKALINYKIARIKAETLGFGAFTARDRVILNNAKERLLKTYNLYKMGYVSLSELKKAEDRYESILDTVLAKERNYKTLLLERKKREKEAEENVKKAYLGLKKIENELRFEYIKSPMSGFLVNLKVNQGDFVGQNDILGEVINIDKVKLKGAFFPGTYRFLHIGMIGRVQCITTPAYNGVGAIEEISPVVDPTTGRMSLYMILKNKNYILQPGTKCLITFTFKKKDVEAMGIEVQSKKIYIRSKIKSHEIK